nr:adhesin [Providencia sp. 21OH12SH02B-Prov]
MFKFKSYGGIRVRIRHGKGIIALLFIAISFEAIADYAAQIVDPNTGYVIKLERDSELISKPIVGSNGKNYYRIGNTMLIDSASKDVSVSGQVRCHGRQWGKKETNIPSDNAFHRLFMYAPMAGTHIEGKPAYQINSNLIMTVETNLMNWVNIDAAVCSNGFGGDVFPSGQFYSQFPIKLTFYIGERIIDGQLVINAMDLGGYVRAFTANRTVPPYDSWPINETTVPLRLAASQIHIDSLCTTTTSTGQAETVSLRHGKLNSLNYDSTVTEKIFYSCKFKSSTNIRLRLDYTKDSDPQKRLPLKSHLNSNDVIYSELTLTDEATGQTGQSLTLEIHQLDTIRVTSRIQGKNAVAGDYQGSAWLIATYDWCWFRNTSIWLSRKYCVSWI